MSFTSFLRRSAGVVAGAGALAVVAAGPASAHHCLVDFQDAARAQVAEGTAWLPLSDLLEIVVVEEFGLSEACASHADEWTAAWVEEFGTDGEPMIHMKATVGGGAAHKKGMEPPPFEYIDDADVAFLEGLIGATPDCA